MFELFTGIETILGPPEIAIISKEVESLWKLPDVREVVESQILFNPQKDFFSQFVFSLSLPPSPSPSSFPSFLSTPSHSPSHYLPLPSPYLPLLFILLLPPPFPSVSSLPFPLLPSSIASSPFPFIFLLSFPTYLSSFFWFPLPWVPLPLTTTLHPSLSPFPLAYFLPSTSSLSFLFRRTSPLCHPTLLFSFIIYPLLCVEDFIFIYFPSFLRFIPWRI